MVVNNRIWVGVAVILIIAIILMGWFLGVSPRLAEVATNEGLRQTVLAQNDAHRAELARLKKENEKLDDYKAELKELQKRIPDESDLSTFIGEIHTLEVASGVLLTNFGSVDAQPFVLDAGLAEDDWEGGVPAVQTVDPTHFVLIEVTLTAGGTQAQILDFVELLQTGNRRYQVNSLKINTEDNVAYVGTIVGYVYVLRDPDKTTKDDDEEDEVTVEPTASPTPTATPSSSPSPSGSPTP